MCCGNDKRPNVHIKQRSSTCGSGIIDTADRGEGVVCSVQGRGDPGIQPVGASQPMSCGQKGSQVMKGWFSCESWGGGSRVPPSELAVGTRLGSGTREKCAEPQDSAFLDGILDRAAKFGRARVLLPELLPITPVNGIGSGSPTLLRL